MKTAQEIVDANLKHYGVERLKKMEDEKFNKIVELMRAAPGEDRAETVDQLLAVKNERAKERSKSPLSNEVAAVTIQAMARRKSRGSRSSSSSHETTSAPGTPAGPTPKEAEKQPEIMPWDLFDAPETPMPTPLAKTGPHELRIVAFNSLKLRINKVALDSQWLNLIKTFACTFDVILISEVPAEENKKPTQTRAFAFKRLLDAYSPDAPFAALISDPCGPGNPETHHIFVKSYLDVVEFGTNFEARKTKLDHAPFSVHVVDERFEHSDNQNWVITSVHFPPKTRSRDRDVQLNAFLEEYNLSANFRLNTPLSAKGARDAKRSLVNHVVAGDFNVYPDRDEYKLASRGFDAPLFGEHIATSAGSESYDNFLVSVDTSKRFTINRQVLELEMVKKPGQDGVSDHHPVAASFKETKLVKKCQK
jgi:endonuclease/exonuclease/phosphatase family metal-dependent hydrolase